MDCRIKSGNDDIECRGMTVTKLKVIRRQTKGPTGCPYDEMNPAHLQSLRKPADLSLQGLRLLVVEDEPLIAMMISDMLQDFGCRVVGPAGCVAHALDLIEREAVDGGLLDVSLRGGQRSYPVAETLRQRGIPFAFVTGYGEAGLIAHFRGIRVLQKPFVADHLRRIIAESIVAAI